MGYAPQYYSYNGNDADEVLYTGKFVSHRSYGHDGRAFSRLKCNK